MDKYDVIIVGAGPAGSTLARLLDKKLNILLINYVNEGKPCGGLLAPDAQKVLAQFDLTLPKEVLVDPQIFSVRTMDLESGLERWYQRMYINMDRSKFDTWLLGLVPENVKVVQGRCIGIVDNVLSYSDVRGNIEKVISKTIVGADGATSIVRRSYFKPLKTRKYTAIQQWFKEDSDDMTPFYSCIFDAKTSDCCSWTISKDGYLIYGGAFPIKNSRKKFELQKKRLFNFGIELSNPVKTEACQVLRPTGKKSFNCGENFEGYDVYLIGEAAGFISPSSLEGFSSAFKSAIALSKAIGHDDALIRYKRNTRKLRSWLICKNLKCPFMYNRVLRKLVMKSGIDSIEINNSSM